MLKKNARCKASERAIQDALHARGVYFRPNREKPVLLDEDVKDIFLGVGSDMVDHSRGQGSPRGQAPPSSGLPASHTLVEPDRITGRPPPTCGLLGSSPVRSAKPLPPSTAPSRPLGGPPTYTSPLT